jgi:predicted lipoprotein with Yx(FWY)xxD motif
MRSIIKLCAAAVLLVGAPAFAQTTVAGVKATPDGLNDAAGMPLYTFARDTTPGKSACNGPCATAWPPLAATAADKDAGDWTVITRDDGSKQWAYKGQPLYTFAKDTAGQPATGVSPAWPRAKG